MSCCSEHNIECCEVCNCFRFSSPNASIQIDKTGCNVNLQMTANTLANILNVQSSECITVIKEIINGQLIFTPIFNNECGGGGGTCSTADNGLHINPACNVQLGGPLIAPTIITTTNTNTLSITGLVTNSTPDYVITETTAGVLIRTLPGDLITADNGLTKTGINIQLGGTLLHNTLVDLATYKLSLLDSGSAPTGLVIVPGASAPTDFVTANVNRFSGKVYANDLTWIDSANVAIGSDYPLAASTSPRLYVLKTVSNGTTTGSNYTAEHKLKLPATFSTVSTTNKYAANVGVTEYYPSSNIIMPINLEKTICGTFSEFIFEPSGLLGDTTSNGRISASAARGYFAYGRNLDTFSGIRVMSPVSDSTHNYTGTISELIGLKIEDQRGDSVIDVQTTKSYGIKQLGTRDENLFTSTTNRFSNLSVYNNNAAAISGGLTIGTLYRTSSGAVMMIPEEE